MLCLQAWAHLSPTCRRRPTASRLIGFAPPTPAARLCTGDWSCVRPMRRCSRWGNKWPPSAWRGKRLFCLNTRLCRPASASAACAERNNVCTSTGDFACCQVGGRNVGCGDVWMFVRRVLTCIHTFTLWTATGSAIEKKRIWIEFI